MRDNRTPSKKTDVSDKKIDSWVYEKVYDAVNPQAENRSKEKAPAKDSYTPNGNAPYWPNQVAAPAAAGAKESKDAPQNVPAELKAAVKADPAAAPKPAPAEAPKAAAAGGLPAELMGSLAQRNKRDISNKNIDPWVYDFAYDNVNPQNIERNGPAPKSDVYWKDIYGKDIYGKKLPLEFPAERLAQEHYLQTGFIPDSDEIMETEQPTTADRLV